MCIRHDDGDYYNYYFLGKDKNIRLNCFLFIYFFELGKIVEKIGYDAGFILCFFAYFLRFVLMSVISNVWWVLPIEAIMQGFSYALSYTLIVSFTNRISRPGIEATMQGLVTAVYDSIGKLLIEFIYDCVIRRL